MEWMPSNIRQLSDYWLGLAGGQTPERSQFHIEDVMPLLPFLLLADFEFNPFRLHYRLSGTRVDQMTGLNLAGRYLDEFATGSYAAAVNEMISYYEEGSRTGRPRVWTYAWAGENPELKTIWAALFPLKVDGVIQQCLSIEDYGEFNSVSDGKLRPDDGQARRDWATLHRD